MPAPTDIHTLPVRLHRPAGNQRGSALIMVTVAIFALFAFALLAIDGAVLLTTKGQLQVAADAAALAGASGLVVGGQDLAVERAIEFAGYNHAVEDTMRSVVIGPEDITFPQADVIRVRTHRTEATGDALHSYFRRVIDPLNLNRADVTAVAVAQCYDVCGLNCLKPWCVPDRWNDTDGDGAYDAGEYYETGVTSYQEPRDIGTLITLKVGDPHATVASGQFYPCCFPPLDYPGGPAPQTGGEWYRTWISECNPYTVQVGDRLLMETGNKVGPTRQGVEDLYNRDPGARWDTSNQTVTGSAYGMSPRIALLPMFDPRVPPASGRDWVRVVRIGVVFIEQINGNEVRGRFMSINRPGVACAPGSPGAAGGLVQGISLIQ